MFVNPHAAKASINVPEVLTTGNNIYGEQEATLGF